MRRDDFLRKKCHRIKISGEKKSRKCNFEVPDQVYYYLLLVFLGTIEFSKQAKRNKNSKKNADVSFNVQIIGPWILLLLMIIGAIESDIYGCGEKNADNTLLDCRNNVVIDQMASVQSFAAPLLCAYRNSDIKRYIVRITYTGQAECILDK